MVVGEQVDGALAVQVQEIGPQARQSGLGRPLPGAALAQAVIAGPGLGQAQAGLVANDRFQEFEDAAAHALWLGGRGQELAYGVGH